MKSPFNTLNLGLQELIAVLVPGAVVNTFLIYRFGGHFFPRCEGVREVVEWSIIFEFRPGWSYVFAFFVASYFTGYALFVASSPLEGVYDRIKRLALDIDVMKQPDPLKLRTLLYFFFPNLTRDKYLKNSKEVVSKEPANWIINLLFPYLWETHQLIEAIVEHKNKHIGTYHDGPRSQTIDAYQYCYRLIMNKHPEMFAEVERYMVTAKFFRSMTFGWLICGSLWMGCTYSTGIWLFVALSAISFFTFLNRWRKAHHVAFKNVIIAEPIKKDASASPPNDALLTKEP